jgi:hypothetical protein
LCNIKKEHEPSRLPLYWPLYLNFRPLLILHPHQVLLQRSDAERRVPPPSRQPCRKDVAPQDVALIDDRRDRPTRAQEPALAVAAIWAGQRHIHGTGNHASPPSLPPPTGCFRSSPSSPRMLPPPPMSSSTNRHCKL